MNHTKLSKFKAIGIIDEKKYEFSFDAMCVKSYEMIHSDLGQTKKKITKIIGFFFEKQKMYFLVLLNDIKKKRGWAFVFCTYIIRLEFFVFVQ